VAGSGNTAVPAEFLTRQMQWRESLDEAQSLEQVRLLANEVAGVRARALEELQRTLDVQHDYRAAARQLSALMFVERFVHDVDQRLEALGQ
jgi:molecular chaperone HscB